MSRAPPTRAPHRRYYALARFRREGAKLEWFARAATPSKSWWVTLRVTELGSSSRSSWRSASAYTSDSPPRVRFCAAGAPFELGPRRANRVVVFTGPADHVRKRSQQGAAQRRESVFDAGWDSGKHFPVNEPVSLQIAKGLRQHPL